MNARKRLALATVSLFFSAYLLALVEMDKKAQVIDRPTALLPGLTMENKRPKPIIAAHQTANVRDLSSVDYMACCGAGHRLSKLSDANYLSKLLGFTLRSYWGYCNTTADDSNGKTRGQTEVFHYLFGPQPIEETNNVTSRHQYARINNDVPGFQKLKRNGDCSACDLDKAAADATFYAGLRDRFRLRNAVADFRRKYFGFESGHQQLTVIGMHIRAGNGETGDFTDRGRAIGDTGTWLKKLTKQVLQAHADQNWGESVLFLATDTPSLIDKVRDLLAQGPSRTIPVVHYDQVRPTEGSGVMFGEQGKVVREGEQCLQGWENTIMDMILLSHADVLIAARPSSFTQSLPMQLVLETPKTTRTVLHPFCEVNPAATEMRCYSDFSDWCCNGRTEFSLQGIHQKYEYLRMPQQNSPLSVADAEVKKRYKINDRPVEGCVPRPLGWKQVCLPYNWSEFVVEPWVLNPTPPLLAKRERRVVRHMGKRRKHAR